MKALEFLEHKLQVLDDSIAKNDPFVAKTRSNLRDAIEELKSLSANAQRYAGLRMLICEPDTDARDRMLQAIETLMDAQPEDMGDTPEPSRVDELVDAMLLTAAKARAQ